jgi:hypothetical protein
MINIVDDLGLILQQNKLFSIRHAKVPGISKDKEKEQQINNLLLFTFKTKA